MTSRNYTEYSGAEQWLRDTYPFIHSVWAASFTNPTSSMINLELKCKICELKPSTGIHYGVKMCEADKQFLKRSFHYQLVYSACSQEDSCPPRPRGWCQMCRLRKCLSFPVKINMIRIGSKTSKTKTREEPAKISITVIPPSTPAPEYDFKHLPTLDFFQYREPTLIPGPEYNLNLIDFEPRIEDNEPLDLTVKRREPPQDNDWFSDELLFTSWSQDVSPYHSTGDHSYFNDFFLPPPQEPQESLSRRTPSPVLDASQSLYKLSVNSTILGDALSRIQSNISMSNSLVNLTSVSDILTDSDK